MNVENYLAQSDALVAEGRYTDGCSTPFKTQIHRALPQAKRLCAAHDFGSMGLIKGVGAGVANNWWTWRAHLAQKRSIYWAWGTVIALGTLPYAIWRGDLGMTFLPMVPFHVLLLSALGAYFFLPI